MIKEIQMNKNLNPNLEVKYDNPPIIPVALISKKKLKMMLSNGKLGKHTSFFLVDSSGDQKWCSHEGKLCLNLCYYTEWGLSGKSFVNWLTSIKHVLVEDSNPTDMDYNMKIHYFNYYHLV